jgi:hypothetical protein
MYADYSLNSKCLHRTIQASPSRAHLEISEIMDDARNESLEVSQSNTKSIEKPFVPSCWRVLKLRERPFIADCYSRWNLGPSFWTGVKRSRARNATDRAYRHLSLVGTRLYKWTGTLWKNRVWRRSFWLECVLFSWFLINIYCRRTWLYFLGNPRTK